MKKYIWSEHNYYKENCTGEPLTNEIIRDAESKLGYKLPQAYIDMMKSRNGGNLIRNYWVNKNVKSNEVNVIGIECFYSIGSEKNYSLFGKFGNEFWFSVREYPRDVGVIIADTESGGHDMIYLDYRECGKNGEPKVSVCFQEYDYEIQVLANSFEEFLTMLITEEEV
ncbi:SMI1/KNR4 family protein [Gemelliphila palaticanis]|uniref:SMI1/KNR4 family protein n=1 Tax=Gemelliphila palaticanis TaxID=81950 RepID=UPI001C54DD9F|nr:SMI1/KNR4 family protein [Gemella palaticanis]